MGNATSTSQSQTFPDIKASENLLKEMQREKERLHRYFQSQKRTQSNHEKFEKYKRDLVKKKQEKFMKREEQA